MDVVVNLLPASALWPPRSARMMIKGSKCNFRHEAAHHTNSIPYGGAYFQTRLRPWHHCQVCVSLILLFCWPRYSFTCVGLHFPVLLVYKRRRPILLFSAKPAAISVACLSSPASRPFASLVSVMQLIWLRVRIGRNVVWIHLWCCPMPPSSLISNLSSSRRIQRTFPPEKCLDRFVFLLSGTS